MKIILTWTSLVMAMLFFLVACNSQYTTKKPGYFKIDFPERSYVKFEKEGFPYSFEYPSYAKIVRDTAYFDSTNYNPYWLNVDFPTFNGKIYLSYKVIGGSSVYKVKTPKGYRDSSAVNTFENMVNDAYKLTYKNEIKANSIEDSLMQTPNNLHGIFFSLTGSVATSKQFYLTDTTRNFLRGALYFNATPNEDSLAPINMFLQEDMKHLINTLKWR